jgi:broad specificity phosphatase PhoE
VTCVILVRHGEASAGWGDDPDPGLSAIGRQQAEAVAEVLGPLGPCDVVTSPLRRCRETAAPLAQRWGVEPRVVEAVSELPSPPRLPTAERPSWLLSLADRTWDAADPETRDWRDHLVSTVAALSRDTVVFTHFVAVNVIVGAALGDDRVFVARFGNCSRTVLEVVGGTITVVEQGAEAESRIT